MASARTARFFLSSGRDGERIVSEELVMIGEWKIALGLTGALGAALAAPAFAGNMVAANNAALLAGGYIYQDLGNLSIVNSGGVQYRWARDGISIDLVPGQQSWTQAEAIMARDAFDKLPDVYLRMAQSGGVQRIQRDSTTPQAPWNFIEPPGPNIVAVAVPPSPWNYISVTNEIFSSANECYRVLTHELGHCCEWEQTGWGITLGCGFTDISWLRPEPLGFKTWNGFVTAYARTNQREDYAESCCYYWLANAKLKSINGQKWQYMHDNCFGGLVPDGSKEVDLPTVAPVTPKITGLSASDHDPLMPCSIYGNYFMGPTDGGFNTVYVRGGSTLHVPVSETTIVFTTPYIDAGWAPVQVQTQDGWSNQQGYTVDKPWYQFW
jgi:hypothetical protein